MNEILTKKAINENKLIMFGNSFHNTMIDYWREMNEGWKKFWNDKNTDKEV
jgi:hypothetical protein